MTIELPEALPGRAEWLETAWGRVRRYTSGSGAPVLLLHSFNAAASAYEMRPLYEALAAERQVHAIDWLGFGRSDRPDAPYGPDLYGALLRQAIETIGRETGAATLDVIALSLPSQYVVSAVAAGGSPLGKLVLISPTGFGRFGGEPGPRGRVAFEALRRTGAGALLFAVLARRQVIRWFERQIFADPDATPAALVEYSWRSAQQRGARHAPLRFITGLLKLAGAEEAYVAVDRPALLLFGDDPRFADPEAARRLAERNARLQVVEIERSGDLPHWERPAETLRVVRDFLG